MPGHGGAETDFELTTIERLKKLGYEHRHGADLDRSHDEVVLRDVLRRSLECRYPDLPDTALHQAITRFSRPGGIGTLRRNLVFHQALTRGIELAVEHPDGRREHRHVYAVDWDEPLNNEFWIVNQLPVHGQNDRRPDLVVYVNGLPLVLFEMKNPYAAEPTIDDALNQIQHYRNDIPQIFEYNALVIVSDGVNTHHGMWTASPEWYAPWKSIDGFEVEPGTTGSMKTLVEGLFQKDRLLHYVRDFIVFEEANDRITKKGARYHQFFAVRLAAAKAIDTVRSGGDKRIGVIWHTTGSGKSLSMAFLVGILRRRPELENPTFVIQVDRTDLDDQLHEQFVAARSLVGDVQHAENAHELRSLTRTEGGEIIFTTIEKFRLGPEELSHPVLSERSNIVIIADEAHRSQYGFQEGYARYLMEALPNARRIGFTGTPVSLGKADTVAVFGDVIHTYDIRQSQEDRMTVPIYYAPRQVRLHLNHTDVDAALQEVGEGQGVEDFAPAMSRWARLAAAAGVKERVEEIARDLLDHYFDRTATLEGKAIVVCMTRANCVRLYGALTALPGCPEVKVVMTGNLGTDPPEWSAAGHLTTKAQREAIKQRMIDPDDPLRIVIVCDMWLTGSNIPCLHTLYVDKPMRGHTIIQAISRVNRVFRDKPHGLVVDYIGIADELREATERYTQGGGRGLPAPNIDEEARPVFFAAIEDVRELFPAGHDYGAWRRMSNIEIEDLYALVYGHLAEDDTLRDAFLQAEMRLTNAFLLVKHLDDCRAFADEVIFCQRVRKQIGKTVPGRRLTREEFDRAVRDLVDDAVESEGVVDIFHAAGIERADISVLDDRFLQTFKNRPHDNLRIKLLERLLRDELQARRGRNLAQMRSFREMLEATLQKYHNRLIDAAAVIRAMIEIRKELETEEARARELGLGEDEVAFYDAVAAQGEGVYDQAFLSDLVHDVVQTIKGNLKVDWTEPHREDVKAAVRAAVRRVLRKRGVRAEDIDRFVERFIEQAAALFRNWPLAA